MKIIIIIKLKYNKVFLNGLNPKPNDKIEINSLSLFNLLKHRRRPNININGKITVKIFGINKKDSNRISITSIFKKLVIVKSLVTWRIQAIDKKINNIKIKYFEIW